jgi:hypothetical protein
MIKHLVMFKLKEFAEGGDKARNLQKLKDDLEALEGKIDEIRFFEVGTNLDGSDAAYDLALCSEFESMETLRSYQRHPEHQKVANFVKQACQSRVVVDYQT